MMLNVLRGRIPHLAGFGALALMLLVSGCVSDNPLTGAESGLNSEELDFANALSSYARGLIYQTEYNSDADSREQYEKALQFDPGRKAVFLRIGELAIQKNDNEDAIRILDRMRFSNPDSAEIWRETAVVYEALDDLPRTEESLSHAIKLQPTNSLLYIQLASALFVNEKDKKALSLMKKAVKATENKKGINSFLFSKAKSMVHDGDVERAIPIFIFIEKHVSKTKPELASYIAELYSYLGDDDNTEHHLKRALKLKNSKPANFLMLAAYYNSKMMDDKALNVLHAADKSFPDNSLIPLSMARTHMHRKDFSKAIPFFREAARRYELSEKKPDEEYFLGLNIAHLELKNMKEAEQALLDCLELYPNSHHAMNQLAYARAVEGIMLDESYSMITKALRFEPHNHAYMDTLGWILYKQGKYEEALQILLIAKTLSKTEDAVIMDHIGDAYIALSKSTEAIDYWKKSISVDSSNEEVLEKLKKHGVDTDDLLSSIEQKAEDK